MEPENASESFDTEVASVTVIRPVGDTPVTELSEVDTGQAVVTDPSSLPGTPAKMQGHPVPDQLQVEVNERAGGGSEDDVPLHRNGKLPSVIECMLFVSAEPLSCKQIADTLEIEESRVREAIEQLDRTLASSSGLQLMRVAGGYQLCTRPEYADYCSKILQPARRKLSKAALETLAVVAYRQPCTIPEIEAVRGVSVDGVMHTLIERGLVREAGRKKAPGRPILYATTQEFLEYFGLNDVSELPDIDMLAVEEVKALERQRELFDQHDE